MQRGWRIAAVSAGLLAGGAVFGALAGMIALLAGLALTGDLGGFLHGAAFDALWIVGMMGAFFGAVLLPLAGFTVLRRVPLWLTAVGTVTGTVIGGAVGWALQEMIPTHQAYPELVGAVLGFLAAALLLRVTAGRRVRTRERVAVPAPVH